eukprot:13949166-Ditylum_brightwellii.AAC.1
MNREPPPGRKIGLIHCQYIWAYLLDPFQHEWQSTYEVNGPLATHINKMILNFIPLDDHGFDSNQVRVFNDFMNFHQQQGDWLPFFASPLPNEVTGAQLTANKKNITLDQV